MGQCVKKQSNDRRKIKYSQAHMNSPVGHLYLKYRVERMCQRLKWPGLALALVALVCLVLTAAFPIRHAWYN